MNSCLNAHLCNLYFSVQHPGRGGGFKKEFLMNWGKKCKMGHQKASFFILFDTCDPKIIYFPKVSRKKPLKIINRP